MHLRCTDLQFSRFTTFISGGRISFRCFYETRTHASQWGYLSHGDAAGSCQWQGGPGAVCGGGGPAAPGAGAACGVDLTDARSEARTSAWAASAAGPGSAAGARAAPAGPAAPTSPAGPVPSPGGPGPAAGPGSGQPSGDRAAGCPSAGGRLGG